MNLNELLKTVQPVDVIGRTDIEITGVDIDSRRVETGHLFMAMRGTQTDGHAYIPAAIGKGACAIVCEELPAELQEGITYVRVKDSEDATGRIATLFYGDPTSQLELVGVTGTNGKTTTATLLYRLFRHFGYKVGLISTVCNYIDDEPVPTDHTTPDPITLNQLLGRMADAGCQYAFMEVSSHAIAQKRISGLRFAGGIFTNLTRDHLDQLHPRQEEVLRRHAPRRLQPGEPGRQERHGDGAKHAFAHPHLLAAQPVRLQGTGIGKPLRGHVAGL